MVNSGLGPCQAGTLKNPRPTCLALGSENRSENGAQAAGTESLTGEVWAGNGVTGFKTVLRL